eukprot:UN10717
MFSSFLKLSKIKFMFFELCLGCKKFNSSFLSVFKPAKK